VGEGWTGALGTGRIDEVVGGHLDDEEPDVPVKMYGGGSNNSTVVSSAVGWGHTALIAAADDDESGNRLGDRQLLVTGRPHDFSALLRLQRLPTFLRDYSVRQTLQTTYDPAVIAGGAHDPVALHPVSLVGRAVTYLSQVFQKPGVTPEDWEEARRQSFLPSLAPVRLPRGEVPAQVACSAGLTAVACRSGGLYAFGLNGIGQCGVGYGSNNVWGPERVTGLSSEFAEGPRAELGQSHPIRRVALGLQHGLCLNSEGELFAWGKGERGQLGQETMLQESHVALPIKKALELTGDFGESAKPLFHALGKISQISCGMIHSAALDAENNAAYVWGKNVLPRLPGGDPGRPASDARLPVKIRGLPDHLRIEQISCGSHHTAVLLEDGSVWAAGVSSDTKEPLHMPVEIIPAGVVDSPVRQFAAHMDRTTVVGADGEQVFQVRLWKDPERRDYAVFTPAWVDLLLDALPANERIREVHRSWIHTIVVTD
jgi:hypothetical protein